MHTRFNIIIQGDHFNPDDVIDKLETDLVVDLSNKPDDLREGNETYGYGWLDLLHKNQFSTEYPDEAYEKVFVDFFEKNYSLLKQAGATDFAILLEVYYSDQCNFEIFNKDQLKILAQYDVSLPISVYYEGD